MSTAPHPALQANAPRDPERQFQDHRAKLALKGHELYRLDGGAGFLVRRWGLSKELRDLAAVAEFCQQVGAT